MQIKGVSQETWIQESGTQTSGIQSRAFEAFSQAAGRLAGPGLRRWKQRGGRVVGFFCSMVPEELFMAAGLLPFRMRATGSRGTELADPYFTRLNCTFPRNCMNQALEGEFGFLDGLVGINSCDHIRRLYDNWERQVPLPFLHFLVLPRQTGPEQIAWYADEIRNLKKSLEQHLEVEIGDRELRSAIALANQTRRLQRRLYQLRKRDRPPITGSQALVVMIAGTAMPKDEYNALLAELLEELEARDGVGGHRARMMITGGILDDPSWVAAIEEMGGLVVSDGTCFGTRLMWNDVPEQLDDPIHALARYYLADRPSCPRLCDLQERRTRFTTEMFREFRCDGIIGEQMIFCDQWNLENYLLANDLAEQGIPFLKIEREYLTSGTGQLKTRVQAFIESLGK
jgi:benzoyl-CoA reductase/2-hydroxyglutaryl-CoA dehydratase subunit BcrC/BadD/HgdB